MTSTEKREILAVIGKYLNDPHVQQMKEYIQHGSISTYKHAINVTKIAYRINKKLGLNADLEVLLTAALLHDFYLYDWHDRPNGDLHGYKHPKRAVKKAVEIFDVNEEVQAAIESHMWPLTLRSKPKSPEAWIVCSADKIASTCETLWMRKEKQQA